MITKTLIKIQQRLAMLNFLRLIFTQKSRDDFYARKKNSCSPYFNTSSFFIMAIYLKYGPQLICFVGVYGQNHLLAT
jgi:hypothetical protein